jgi:hypothetical protein
MTEAEARAHLPWVAALMTAIAARLMPPSMAPTGNGADTKPYTLTESRQPARQEPRVAPPEGQRCPCPRRPEDRPLLDVRSGGVRSLALSERCRLTMGGNYTILASAMPRKRGQKRKPGAERITTVSLPADMMVRAKMLAVRRGMPFKAILLEGIRLVLARYDEEDT